MLKPRITAVILAAGLSRRMGSDNKLLLPVSGDAMVARTLKAYLPVCDDVVVVTGFEAARIAETVEKLPVRIVHNSEYERGQAGSVAAGLQAVGATDHVIVGLGDQPLLHGHHIETLLAQHTASAGEKITIPHNGQSRGNPIVIPAGLIPQMLADKLNPGCGAFTRNRSDLANMVQLQDPAFFRDVDTPDDYQALAQSAVERVP